MMQNQTDLLTDILHPHRKRRKELLPLWIKIFMWLFLIGGLMIPVVLVVGILGLATDLGIYGLETHEAFSFTGIFVMMIFAIKGIVSFGMLREKYWAVKIGIIDAVLGIAVCLFFMLYHFVQPEIAFSFRLELLVLIPYLAKLIKIRKDWEHADNNEIA